MFEIFLLIGFFAAGISQLLPKGTPTTTPKQQYRKRVASKTNYIRANQCSRKKTKPSQTKLKPRRYFVERESVQFLNPPRKRENSSAGIGLP